VVVEVERVVEVEVERTMMASDIQRGGTLILGTPQVVQFLDPQRGGLANNRNATHGLFNSLTFWGDDGAPTNDLATAWEVSSDGLTWNFDLERNVKFHNGRQMTAADVKFSFDRILDPEFTAARFFARSLAAVDRVSVVDESTVRFELSEPSGTLLSSMINTRIVAKENVDVIDNSAIGTGPFKLAEYVVNDKVVLNAFPDYFLDGEDGGALPYLDGVIVRTIPDTTALFTALETGIVDVYWQLAPKFAVQLDGSTNALAVPSSFQTNYSIFLFEIDRGVFQDRDARLALLHAIDKDAIVTVGFEGLAEPGYTNNILGPGSLFLKSDLKEYRQDPEMVRQLFQDLGITKLKFVAPAVNPEWKPISIVLERNLNDVGVELDIELLSVEAWFASIGNLGETDWFDTNMFSTNIRFLPPEPDIPITSWTCGNHFASGWCDEEMDMWTVRGRQAVDPAERREAYFKVQELWNEKVPAIPFGYRSIHHGQTNRVRDLKNLFADLYYTGTWLVR
jgi:peptide/nickel transport system substrate-binding protein